MNPPGTLAYITEEEALLVRVNKGWQYIAVSDFFLIFFLLYNSKQKLSVKGKCFYFVKEKLI